MKVIYDRHPRYPRMMIVDVSDFFVEHLAYVDALVDDDETFVAYAVFDHHDTPQPVHPAGCVWPPFSYVIFLPGQRCLRYGTPRSLSVGHRRWPGSSTKNLWVEDFPLG